MGLKYEERCCCGNLLRPAPCKIIRHPCQCEKPGKLRTESPLDVAFTQGVAEFTYNERKKFGLPLRTGLEQMAELRRDRE